jgi:hypothetical protein
MIRLSFLSAENSIFWRILSFLSPYISQVPNIPLYGLSSPVAKCKFILRDRDQLHARLIIPRFSNLFVLPLTFLVDGGWTLWVRDGRTTRLVLAVRSLATMCFWAWMSDYLCCFAFQRVGVKTDCVDGHRTDAWRYSLRQYQLDECWCHLGASTRRTGLPTNLSPAIHPSIRSSLALQADEKPTSRDRDCRNMHEEEIERHFRSFVHRSPPRGSKSIYCQERSPFFP